MRRIRFVVEGRVQGVGFRQATWLTATRLGLAGWVTNDRWDRRRVLGEAEGEEADVKAFQEWLAGGPPLARVQRVLVEDLRPEGPGPFLIR